MIYSIEPEVQDGLRSFAKTQELFTGVARAPGIINPIDCTWYGAAISPMRGAFCLVQEGAGLEDFVGEFLQVSYARRSVAVYCLGETPELPVPLGLTQRAFMGISILPVESIRVYTEVVE